MFNCIYVQLKFIMISWFYNLSRTVGTEPTEFVFTKDELSYIKDAIEQEHNSDDYANNLSSAAALVVSKKVNQRRHLCQNQFIELFVLNLSPAVKKLYTDYGQTLLVEENSMKCMDSFYYKYGMLISFMNQLISCEQVQSLNAIYSDNKSVLSSSPLFGVVLNNRRSC